MLYKECHLDTCLQFDVVSLNLDQGEVCNIM